MFSFQTYFRSFLVMWHCFSKKNVQKIFLLKQRGEHSVGSTGVSFEKNTVLMDNNV